jgi:hypothetical protein
MLEISLLFLQILHEQTLLQSLQVPTAQFNTAYNIDQLKSFDKLELECTVQHLES